MGKGKKKRKGGKGKGQGKALSQPPKHKMVTSPGVSKGGKEK